MPARDPAASPHLASLPPSGSQATLPIHHQSNPSVSPLSSTFSVRTHQSIPSQDQPYLNQVFRRFSVDRSNIQQPAMEAPGGNGLMQDDIGSLTSQHDKRRRFSNESEVRSMSVGSMTSSAIRESTSRLASMSFNGQGRNPSSDESVSTSPGSRPSLPGSSAQDHRPHHPSHLSEIITEDDEIPSPRTVPASLGHGGPSALSVMMDKERSGSTESLVPPVRYSGSNGSVGSKTPSQPVPIRLHSDSSGEDLSGEATPTGRPAVLRQGSEDEDEHSSSALRTFLSGEVEREDAEAASEVTPLLGTGGNRGGWTDRAKEKVSSLRSRAGKFTTQDVVRECVQEPAKAVPAVILGLLLNVLDGVSYGMILFPANANFGDFGSMGVSMFFMSCIVSQLTFTLGGSIFKGGNGSMMIEAVPFFHILVNIIEGEIGDDPRAIVATTMASFAFSSILTGLVFMALGTFRLGVLIGYFPRHILVGCIGGVGVFLIETGLEVAVGLKEEGFEYNLATLKYFFGTGHMLALWIIPLVLAILLRVITHFYHHQLIFPAYFFVIPVIFYIVVAIGGWDFETLRTAGWVFDVGKNTQAWWKFYSLYDFSRTNWSAFWAAMPTQLALVFFGILHVPALGVSLGEDNVKLDRELVAHGISNLGAGFIGTVPNYLCYVNTVLFYRVGGGSRLSGLMLVAATAAIMFVGPTVIGYLPVMVVGALIFVLGIDLATEAVWDTRNRVNRMEYITIWVITIGMTIFDFVIGLLLGIILACVFFVVQSSRRKAIRTVFNGAMAKSTVRRPRAQREFIHKVGSQTYVMKLQGFLFFGTITTVEEEIRKLLDRAKWDHSPIRFLIIDFALVHGLDFSSAEAFVRIQRLLSAKDVLLILCGAAPQGLVGTALQSVDLWADREGTRVEVFGSLNDSLEWTENAYLTAFYESQNRKEDEGGNNGKGIDFPKVSKPPFSLAESFQNSPRRTHLANAGDATLPTALTSQSSTPARSNFVQPLPILMLTFGGYTTESHDFFFALVPYFTAVQIMGGDTLWKQHDPADGLYLIESGCLRATYSYDDHSELVQETMVSGTVAGELSMLSDTPRNATVVAEKDSRLWKLDRAGLERMEGEKPGIARKFVMIVLKSAAEEVDVLSSHLVAVLS